MYRELTNLLPPNKSRAFRREYFLHAGTVCILGLSFVVIVHGLLLLPTYLSLEGQLSAQKQQLAKLNTDLEQAGQKDVSNRLTALTTDASYLTKLGTIPTASAVTRAVLTVAHPGIVLTSLAYTPPTDATPGHFLLTGTASTRDALRAYDLALAQLPFVSNADLPISSYAAETNIPFTITLSGTFML
jgi:Tfp pilus assembly protein PilN